MAEEISREHGATVLAAVGTRPLEARALPGFGRPTCVIAPPTFAVPAFPARPASEGRRHVRFSGLPWQAAVRGAVRTPERVVLTRGVEE